MVQMLGCQILFAFVVVVYAMAEAKEASEFSPVESFTTILRKLAAEDFASKKLLRHYAIQRQIESLPAGIVCSYVLAILAVNTSLL